MTWRLLCSRTNPAPTSSQTFVRLWESSLSSQQPSLDLFLQPQPCSCKIQLFDEGLSITCCCANCLPETHREEIVQKVHFHLLF
jgi:hypothetical protein